MAATTSYFNWREAKVLGAALKGTAEEALTPAWAAVTQAVPVVWRVASNPINLLLYLIAFASLVKYPHIMVSVVAALSGSAGAAGT